MWELGYAQALQKPAIILNQDVGESPFDISNMRQVVYDRTRLSKELMPQLVTSTQAVVARLLRAMQRAGAAAPGQPTDDQPLDEESVAVEQEAARLAEGTINLEDAVVQLDAIEIEVDVAAEQGNTVRLQELCGETKHIVDRLNDADASEDAKYSLAAELGDLAVSLYNASLYREAEDLFNRAMGLGITHTGVMIQYALFSALHKKDYDRANGLLDRAKSLGADENRLASARAQIAGSRALRSRPTDGDEDPSWGDQIRRMYENNPDAWETFAAYVALLTRTNSFDEIDTVCEKRLATVGDDLTDEECYRTTRVWADVLADSGDVPRQQKAAEMYRRILEVRPDNADVLSNLAALLGTFGEGPESMEYFLAAYRLSPNDITIRRNLSRAVQRNTDRKDLAVKILRGEQLTQEEVDSLRTV